MKSIGLFFGSFNPIHLGHTNLAEYIFQFSGVDEIWFVISPKNPLKDPKELLDEHLRLKMLQLATTDRDYLKVSDIEFDLPKPSYTISTLKVLSERYPEDDFILLIGSDNMQIFDQWKDYQTILEDYSVVVYPREGYPYQDFEETYPDMQVLEEAPLFEISSTEIRKLITEKKDASQWLHPEVYHFILENKLYQQ